MKRIKKVISFLAILLFSTGQMSCGGNFFKDVSFKTSDQAKYEDALKAIDNGDYTAAIALIQGTSATFAADQKVIQTLAGAYAGQCGLDFITVVTGLSSSSGAPFLFFMNAFKTISVVPASCYTAQTKMELIGNSSQRTGDQNLFMFILGIAKLGSYLKATADTNSDGVADHAHISCANQGGPYLSDADINQIITGLGLIFDNFTAVSASIGGSSVMAALNGFKSTCALLTGIPNCAITDPNSVTITGATRTVFRELIQTSDFGIQSSCTSAQIGTPSGGGTICCP